MRILVSSQHTTEMLIHTPWQSLSIVSDRYPIVVVSKVQKQSVSNAFQYVVLHLAAPHISLCFPAIRADSKCKDNNFFWKQSKRIQKLMLFYSYIFNMGSKKHLSSRRRCLRKRADFALKIKKYFSRISKQPTCLHKIDRFAFKIRHFESFKPT